MKPEPMNDVVMLLKALKFSADKHTKDRRKDVEESPYINHPIQVATLLAVEAGIDDITVLQAALLHDTVEDTETSYEELVEVFGAAVADVVMEVTNDPTLSKAEQKRMQIVNAPHKSAAAALVKLADKTCNLRDIASMPPADWALERKQDYFDMALQVAEGLPQGSGRLRALFDGAFAARPIA